MSQNKPIQLGLCCLNITMRESKPTVFSSRTMIIRTVKEKGIEYLKEKIIQNLKDTIKLIQWNEKNGIKVFRLSSNLFPHKSNPKIDDYTFDFAKPYLKLIGKIAKKYNQRLTFHPGQYNVVGTPNEKVFLQTINDLSYHAEVLDLMEMGCDSVMVVHGGGLYGDKEKTMIRWCEQYKLLPENIKKRLVLENCEKCFSIEDCLKISEKVNIPVVFDTHHYECYNLLHPENQMKPASEYIEAILNTWKKRGIKPKFHVSEQGAGRTGHHSDFIEVIPDYLMEIPEKYNTHIDIMIEAKKKELAIRKLYEKYPKLNCLI
tara:strand:+ start:1648 stop:2598 length:951 start_codon:yes stop_codon:yes gene_type:complete